MSPVLPDLGDYQLTRLLVRRGVALVYLVAFLVAARQFRPLLGEDGLLPVPRFLERVPFRRAPSLFHLTGYSDRLAGAMAWSGVALSVAAALGLPASLGTLPSASVWLALWILYLSFVNVGQVFYGYGWESQLLETDEAVLGLLAEDPFDGERPARVRARWYRYEFTDPAERRATGRWWRRELLGSYLPPLDLASLREGGPAAGRRAAG